MAFLFHFDRLLGYQLDVVVFVREKKERQLKRVLQQVKKELTKVSTRLVDLPQRYCFLHFVT